LIACRTASRIHVSPTAPSPPRTSGDDISDQRIASAPYRSNISSGSGKLRLDLLALRPSSPRTMPYVTAVRNAGRSNSAVDSTCSV
jgi:hypothetical protein